MVWLGIPAAACSSQARELVGGEPECGRAGHPLRGERDRVDVAFGLAGGQRRHLRRGAGGLTAFSQPLLDGLPPLGERADDRLGDTGQVGGAVDHGVPGDAEPAGELVAQLGLVQVAGGLGVPVQPRRVQRPPAAVIGLHSVPDHDMSVQEGITVA